MVPTMVSGDRCSGSVGYVGQNVGLFINERMSDGEPSDNTGSTAGLSYS